MTDANCTEILRFSSRLGATSRHYLNGENMETRTDSDTRLPPEGNAILSAQWVEILVCVFITNDEIFSGPTLGAANGEKYAAVCETLYGPKSYARVFDSRVAMFTSELNL